MEEISQSPKKLDKKAIFFSRLKRRALKHLWLVRLGLVASVVFGIYLFVSLLGFVLGKTPLGFYGGFLADFVFTPQNKIEMIEGQTNVLILGKGGEGHEAPDLTDTIIFASINHSDFRISLISLPRDIWIPSLRAKLNSVYYWGNQKQPPAQRASGPAGEGGGMILTKSAVEEIVGQPVHYGVVVDFSGFKKIIDTLGGAEVGVERSFTDERYPIPGKEDDDCGGKDPEFLCRYETIKFEKGEQLMDGETALKFARSRNAEGEEGTDFARAARQEKVLTAIKNKAVSRKIILNPKKVLEIIRVVKKSVETDLDGSAMAILTRRIVSAKDDIFTHVLSEDFLVRPPISLQYDNLYVFVPKEDPASSARVGQAGPDWSEVHEWVECVLENGECD